MNTISKILPYEMFGGYLFRLATLNGINAVHVSGRARHDKSFFHSLLDYNNLDEDSLFRTHAFILKKPNVDNCDLARATLFPINHRSIWYSFCEVCFEEDIEEYGHTYYRSHLQPKCIFSCPDHNAILSESPGTRFSKADFRGGFSSSREPCSENLFKISRRASNILLEGRLDFDRYSLCNLLRLRTKGGHSIKHSVQSMFDEKTISAIKSRFNANSLRVLNPYRPELDNPIRTADSELIFYSLILLNENEIDDFFGLANGNFVYESGRKGS